MAGGENLVGGGERGGFAVAQVRWWTAWPVAVPMSATFRQGGPAVLQDPPIVRDDGRLGG